MSEAEFSKASAKTRIGLYILFQSMSEDFKKIKSAEKKVAGLALYCYDISRSIENAVAIKEVLSVSRIYERKKGRLSIEKVCRDLNSQSSGISFNMRGYGRISDVANRDSDDPIMYHRTALGRCETDIVRALAVQFTDLVVTDKYFKTTFSGEFRRIFENASIREEKAIRPEHYSAYIDTTYVSKLGSDFVKVSIIIISKYLLLSESLIASYYYHLRLILTSKIGLHEAVDTSVAHLTMGESLLIINSVKFS
jgi:hypothetical protein